ncbi:uncharacterized protein LOC110095060 [Dendrobium catenatum]|uniref:Oxidative stress 3 n=1 Tax=Dendrobium catenatum TaxID=906689 RepID=A0A2I0VFQ4_9ASPA|nr:uncharacterized protein LOC110095060 [Dendrobium catenatum]PKU62240.1 hypothetical protein MA16_Dca026635 [Dendrobium catenatum]
MEDSFIPQISHGIMDEQEEDLGSFSSFDEDDEVGVLSMNSSSSDLMEDANSSPSNDNLEEEDGSLFEMSNLIAQLPLKRGLSKHFQGKSQSFSSLCNVRNLEDLAKPDRPYKKKLKSSKSYGGGLDCHKALSFARGSLIKKPFRGSFSSLGPKRHSFLSNNRPPIPPQRSSGSLSSQALLFA